MNIIQKLLNNKKTNVFIGIVALSLLVIIIIISFYPEKLKFNNYYLILAHIIAIFGIFKIFFLIFKENSYSIKLLLLDSRILFLFALILLFYTPFYIILEKKKIAEQLSIYAYYFLVSGVIYEIILSKFENKINNLKIIIENNKKVLEKKKLRLEKLAGRNKKK